MRNAVGALVVVAVLGAAGADVKFRSVFTSPTAGATSLAGRKVAALVITTDNSLRMSAEEALVRVLETRGVRAVATWRMIPREELQNKDRAQQWFQEAGVEAIVVLRPIRMERNVTEYAPQWTSSSYGTFWGYYGYGTTVAYTPGHTESETTVVVETIVYSLTANALLWGAVSETRDPKGMDAYMKQLVGEAAKEMRKAGLIAR